MWIREKDEWNTAFDAIWTKAVFQVFVNDVPQHMLKQYVFVYLDDILIFSPDEQTHTQHVRQHLLDHQLFIKVN